MDLDSPMGMVHFLFASWLSFNLVFNYIMVVRYAACATHTHTRTPRPPQQYRTPAGVADPSFLTETELRQARMQQHLHRRRGEGFTLWCHNSSQPKPPRAHYCHVSGDLVLKMDHFCPWIGQCVGHYNHRYFLLFLIYLWLSVAYAVVVIALFWAGLISNENASEMQVRTESQTFSLCFVVCAALTVAITFFLVWSGFLAVSNQTTIEYLGNRNRTKEAQRAGRSFHNPFDLGLKDNLRVVFGPFKHYYEFLMPCSEILPTNGHHWQVYSHDVVL